VLDYPSNPRQRPTVVEKTVWAFDDMQQRRSLLSQHALLITEEGPLGVIGREVVAEIICHHFGLLRYEFQVL
jgi:hypothetical protein